VRHNPIVVLAKLAGDRRGAGCDLACYFNGFACRRLSVFDTGSTTTPTLLSAMFAKRAAPLLYLQRAGRSSAPLDAAFDEVIRQTARPEAACRARASSRMAATLKLNFSAIRWRVWWISSMVGSRLAVF
jgi:hypothetical protein